MLYSTLQRAKFSRRFKATDESFKSCYQCHKWTPGNHKNKKIWKFTQNFDYFQLKTARRLWQMCEINENDASVAISAILLLYCMPESRNEHISRESTNRSFVFALLSWQVNNDCWCNINRILLSPCCQCSFSSIDVWSECRYTYTCIVYWHYFVRTHSNTVNDLLRRPSVIIETKTQLYIVCWYVRVRWHQSLT